MFNHFVVFEATCQQGSVIYPQEIIEFPSILVDGATGRILSAFRTYVRPVGNLAVVTWGDWDCRTMLEGECLLGIEKPDYFNHWINLRVPFSSVFAFGKIRFNFS
ncbi:hypothetical protein BDA96_03G217100 [Sorghum bicolor]|uniref:Uncharacterized protein n=1 Tax=Sorghum bicolor TaxID=4558 RepID=A0A921UMZ9_SORBI|nr:hypothetical protein BDA96_03G217100 [Sorghum bicolor]